MSEISLKTYVDTKLTNQQSEFNIKISSLEKATTIAAQSMEKRLEGMNEFRDALRDQTANLLPRMEYDLNQKRTEEDISLLRAKEAIFLNRTEHEILHNKLLDDIRDLRESRAYLDGKASQTSVIISTIIAIVSIIVSAIALFH